MTTNAVGIPLQDQQPAQRRFPEHGLVAAPGLVHRAAQEAAGAAGVRAGFGRVRGGAAAGRGRTIAARLNGGPDGAPHDIATLVTGG
ncbi:hypothetical protein GLX30_00795 [Streptomyces sp. Tu 2975]|uniref:hypothetical protein n=1 Tax=Streptomyces sp. Tu 2975 TaxID=2676871 RepID=UPI0013576599|nr:hypothetical protein [Streptomyces sp. Tu 2975]QIP82862.1 hypothetical protein GLX30_00795 [Streptomyces sp. Tu 2975]